MPVKDSKTEELIKETAKRIFFAEGKLHATTQDIADAAGVNRALLHYYFRSRDILFDVVFKEAMENMHCKMEAIFNTSLDFRAKMEQFIDNFIDTSIEFPYLEAFVITEVVRNPEKREEFMPDEMKKEKMNHFLTEIQKLIEAGKLPKMKTEQFMINLMSLVAYPLLAKPIIEKIFNLDDKGWKDLMRERKQLLINLIFPEVK